MTFEDLCEIYGHPYCGSDDSCGYCYCGAKRYPRGGPKDKEEGAPAR